MIEDLFDHPTGHTVVDGAYDVCVVGAGAAGITVAVALARLGRRVIVLEAGGRTVEHQAQDPYRSEVVGPAPHAGVHEGRVRALGGTTTRWGGQILPLGPLDFADRPWVAGSGWPLSRADLDPWYARAIVTEGLAETLPDDEVWRRLRLPPPELGPGLRPYFSRWCPEPDLGRVNAEVLETSEQLRVLLHCSAVEVLLDGTGARAVRCRSVAGHEFEVRADAFVFAMGAIETCRFFLQPASAGNRLPWSGHPLLGAHFQDHVDADVGTVQPLDRRRFHAAFDNVYLGRHKYHPKVRLDDDAQREFGVLAISATMRFSSPTDNRLLETRAIARRVLAGRGRGLTRRDLRDVLHNLPVLTRQVQRYVGSRRAFNPAGSTIALRVHCEQEPLGPNHLTLSEHTDELGMLRTRVHWQVTELELASIRRFAAVAQDRLRQHGLAHVELEPGLHEESFRKLCVDGLHHMSGMRMGVTPEHGVVDTDLRVHGTDNVHVCSAAVFPTSGSSNPTHTVLALALRLAHHLTRPKGTSRAL